MLELDKEVFYNLNKKDKKVVLVYDSDQEREILDLGLDIEPGPIGETLKGAYPDGLRGTGRVFVEKLTPPGIFIPFLWVVYRL
ncbi:hypothetical protein MTR_0002s0670 [Medicago truncatula]|uniref:Uncharacterized protein n=1 Tax=Medicago truncatula TaxID=3880 RepID=A0A072TJV2_MEDTR|nr:hypothetical protein MTR_0002s0670 [Medicago truncatula]